MIIIVITINGNSMIHIMLWSIKVHRIFVPVGDEADFVNNYVRIKNNGSILMLGPPRSKLIETFFILISELNKSILTVTKQFCILEPLVVVSVELIVELNSVLSLRRSIDAEVNLPVKDTDLA